MKSLLLLVVVVVVVVVVEGCTYVEVKYDEEGIKKAIGRSMELPYPLSVSWKVVTHPAYSEEAVWFRVKGENDQSNPIGFVSFDLVMGEKGDIFHIENGEGMNEYGLTVSANVMMMSNYQEITSPEENKRDIHYFYFTVWALGHFKTVDELIYALKNDVNIVNGDYPNIFFPTMRYHWGVADATGKSVVIEYVDGQLHIFDNNDVGVLTNDPQFEWHLWNLNAHSNVGPSWANGAEKLQMPTPVGNLPYVVSKGTNLLGLPGDFTPQSRFVRMWYLRETMLHNIPEVTTKNDAIIVLTALMNAAFIPRGSVATDPADSQDNFDFTQFTVMKFPHKKEFLYKSYQNQVWKRIRLDELNFKEGARKQFVNVVDGEVGVEDWTSKLMGNTPRPSVVDENIFHEDLAVEGNPPPKNDDFSTTKNVHVQVDVSKEGEVEANQRTEGEIKVKVSSSNTNDNNNNNNNNEDSEDKDNKDKDDKDSKDKDSKDKKDKNDKDNTNQEQHQLSIKIEAKGGDGGVKASEEKEVKVDVQVETKVGRGAEGGAEGEARRMKKGRVGMMRAGGGKRSVGKEMKGEDEWSFLKYWGVE